MADSNTPGLAEIVAQGDNRSALEAIRNKLALELGRTEGKDVAPIAGRLVDVIEKLDALPGGREVSTVDDLAARRTARRERAAGSSGT